jgi:hypothetical protein
MATSEKHQLQELIEDCGFETRWYSGRGMYGRECLGVEVERVTDLADLVVQVMEMARDQGDVSDDVGEHLTRVSFDQMGLGVIFYWPEVPFVGYTEEDPEES